MRCVPMPICFALASAAWAAIFAASMERVGSARVGDCDMFAPYGEPLGDLCIDSTIVK